jgi:3-(3-hydroxy-phenyl)propionate hydroxylase
VSDVDTDVLVVGAGPCGLTLANLLGTYGVRTLVLEREVAPYDFPRAVGIDDESLRTCQTFGLVHDVLADVIENTPIRYYNSTGHCFAHVKPSAKPFGWARRNLFLQPRFEATLRRGVGRFGHVEARTGEELVGFDQDANGVTAVVKGADGDDTTVRARYLVGADGGRSTVRQLAGIELTGTTAPVKWLVVDVADDELDAPYSAVYCDPVQPVLMVPLPYRHRRFEFKLQPEDDEEAMTAEERVRELLRPRYVGTPLPTVVRSRVYLHHSRIAATFQDRRVFLAGDAAHLQPPFFGQGMNSGLRDATNLAWKLAAVVDGRAEAGVLDTYDAERRGHAAAMVGFATRIGRMYSPRNRATERVRDAAFRALQLVPGAREYILQMRYKPMPRYTEGVVVDPRGGRDDPVGTMFMQPVVEAADQRRSKLDDAIGPWFAVIGIDLDPLDAMTDDDRSWWTSIGATFVSVAPSRSGRPLGPQGATTVLGDVDGAFRDWRLANPDREVVVLRPDRYVAAVCDRGSLAAATAALRDVMTDRGAQPRAG